jgi:hypothetical protein
MIVPRSDVIAMLDERLAGQIGAEALAAWAFELFYELDRGQKQVDPADADAIGAVLDELMFADDTSFALDEADLRRLRSRLEQP